MDYEKYTEYDCEPLVLEDESKYHSADYNCCFCDQTDCFYWHLYHHKDVLED